MSPSPAERRAEIERRVPQWQPRSLHGLLDHLVPEHGDRPLVVADEVTWTYADVAERSRLLADGLAALGVEAGDRVGVVLANYPDYVPLVFAISRAGAVAVPLNYLYQAAELDYVVRQSSCDVLVTMTGFAGIDHLGLLDAIAPGWDGPDPAARVGGPPQLRRVVLYRTDGPGRAGVPTLDDLAALGAEHPGAADGRPVDPHALSTIVYTSGTTGSPKGVCTTHDALLRNSFGTAVTRAFEDGRRILFALPLYHLFGYVEGLLAVLWVGGSVVPQTTFTPHGYLQGVERHRATEILAVPTMTVAILEAARTRSYDLSSLRAVMSAAAAAPAWVWERVQSQLGVTEICTGWGMTETAAGITMTRPEDDLVTQSATVGAIKHAGCAGLPDHAGAIAELRTVDPVTGEELGTGEEGEIVVRSPCVTDGFWDKPEETAEVLRAGWFRTGDLGRVRPDGRVQLTGRSKELYKSGGELVMPKEVEELLTGHPGVSQAFAIGLPDERWGEAGCVVIVRNPGVEVTEAEVLALCRDRLARFKVPKHVVFLAAEDLPTTPTGKIQKFRLVRQVAEAHHRSATLFPAPTSPDLPHLESTP